MALRKRPGGSPQGAIDKDLGTGEVKSDPEKRIGYGTDAEIAPLPAASESQPNLVITVPVDAKPAGACRSLADFLRRT